MPPCWTYRPLFLKYENLKSLNINMAAAIVDGMPSVHAVCIVISCTGHPIDPKYTRITENYISTVCEASNFYSSILLSASPANSASEALSPAFPRLACASTARLGSSGFLSASSGLFDFLLCGAGKQSCAVTGN